MVFRELTKSTLSFSWAMSLFGFKQILNSVQPSKAVESFDTVTGATQQSLGNVLNATYRVGDNLQRGLVDLMFNILTLQILNPAGTQASRSASQQSTGWGPVPPPGSN